MIEQITFFMGSDETIWWGVAKEGFRVRGRSIRFFSSLPRLIDVVTGPDIYGRQPRVLHFNQGENYRRHNA